MKQAFAFLELFKPSLVIILSLGLLSLLCWLIRSLQIQPFAHIIETLTTPFTLISGFMVIYPLLNDLIPQDLAHKDLSPNVRKSIERVRGLLLKPTPISPLIWIPLVILGLCSISSFISFLSPHWAYRNPTVVVYSKNYDKDRVIVAPEANKNEFLQLIEQQHSTATEQITLTLPKQINAIFCTPSSELAAKNLALSLAKQGFNLQHIGAITDSSHKDEAEIQLARSYYPELSNRKKALTPEQINTARCSL
jgi:hypothetical protein